MTVEQLLPFPISTRAWLELREEDRGFFCFGDEHLPLHPNHAAQIELLDAKSAERLSTWAFTAIPQGWPDSNEVKYAAEETFSIADGWNDSTRRSEVREWLFQRGVPFQRAVYLLHERNRVVRTTWKMVVRYWDAFAWSVGYAMIVVDHTMEWACCFHHEDVIVFGSKNARTS
jgi:hypothetical protein